MAIDMITYKKIREKRKDLKHVINVLDDVGELLYNNLSDSGIWKLAQDLEDVRFEKYLEYDALTMQLNLVGEKNVKG